LYHLRELSGRKARIREKIVQKNDKEQTAAPATTTDSA